jgi:hypothetical protein
MNSASNAWLKEEWQNMLRRLVAHIETRSADLSDEPIEILASNYTDPARFEAEKQVFLSTPILAGLSLEIPNPGDRLLFDAAGPPIILVRAEDHSVKAFFEYLHTQGRTAHKQLRNKLQLCLPLSRVAF